MAERDRKIESPYELLGRATETIRSLREKNESPESRWIGLNAPSVMSYFLSPGIPTRKIERIFEDVFGMKVTPTTVLGKKKKLSKRGWEI